LSPKYLDDPDAAIDRCAPAGCEHDSCRAGITCGNKSFSCPVGGRSKRIKLCPREEHEPGSNGLGHLCRSERSLEGVRLYKDERISVHVALA